MSIVLNAFLELRTDAETGEARLFGKAGYQTMSPKTDKYTLSNLAAVERAMDAGQLTDQNGEPCKDGAVIQAFFRVNKVKDAADIEQVTSIRTLGGDAVEVPEAPAAAPAANPFS